MKELVIKFLVVLLLCLGYHLCFFGFYIEKQISVLMYSSLLSVIYFAMIVYFIRSILVFIRESHKITIIRE